MHEDIYCKISIYVKLKDTSDLRSVMTNDQHNVYI